MFWQEVLNTSGFVVKTYVDLDIRLPVEDRNYHKIDLTQQLTPLRSSVTCTEVVEVLGFPASRRAGSPKSKGSSVNGTIADNPIY